MGRWGGRLRARPQTEFRRGWFAKRARVFPYYFNNPIKYSFYLLVTSSVTSQNKCYYLQKVLKVFMRYALIKIESGLESGFCHKRRTKPYRVCLRCEQKK